MYLYKILLALRTRLVSLHISRLIIYTPIVWIQSSLAFWEFTILGRHPISWFWCVEQPMIQPVHLILSDSVYSHSLVNLIRFWEWGNCKQNRSHYQSPVVPLLVKLTNGKCEDIVVNSLMIHYVPACQTTYSCLNSLKQQQGSHCGIVSEDKTSGLRVSSYKLK